MTRSRQQEFFIASAGWSDAKVTPLSGDASNRRYFRLLQSDGNRAVLMDAPPDNCADVEPFVRIARHLQSAGLSAPRILAQDTRSGFLLLEDLGDALFAREIALDPKREVPLYELATDVLTALHNAEPPRLKKLDSRAAAEAVEPVFDWYQLGAAGVVDHSAKSTLTERFSEALSPFDTETDVVILRDYHAENLLWLPQRSGVARAGLLDFQDALLGHRAYDLVSILQDARRDVSPHVVTQMTDRFVVENALEPEPFSAAFALYGAQRNLRILGVFARLCMAHGKAQYVDLIPRVWAHVQTNLRHPALSQIAQVVTDTLPPPDPALLDTLKEKCGSCAGP